MSTDGFLLKEQEVSQSLEKLKQEPINADGSHDAVLAPIYTYLMTISPGEDRILHWFCNKARSVGIEAATFLLRLHAYSNNTKVELWKERLSKVLYGCCACVHSYMELKVICRKTYLSAFSKPTLDVFFSAVDKWESNIILDALIAAGLVSGSKRSVSDAPPAVLYHILVSLHLLNEVKILTILREHPPCIQALTWPNQIPPGLLLLLFHESDEIRTWSQQQLSGCQSLKSNQFSDTHVLVLQSVLMALASGPYTFELDSRATLSTVATSEVSMSNYFTMSTSQLWAGLHVFLCWIPDDVFVCRRPLFETFKRAVIVHLHDQGSHFPDVLRTFTFLLTKYGKSVWDGEKDEFPQVVFDAVKNNAAFLSLINAIPAHGPQQPWVLKWFHPYLTSFDRLSSFEQAFKKVVGFACEELQHERFQEKRPAIMACVLQVINSIFRTQKRDGKKIISQIFDVYSPTIIEVAVSLKKGDSPWHQVREPAHRLLSQIINDNFAKIERTIFHLSKFIQEANTSAKTAPGLPDQLGRQESFWRYIYSTFVNDDEEVMVLLITSVGLTAVFDNLNADAYNPSSLSSSDRKSAASIISSVNTALNDIRSGFLTAVTQFTDSSSISSDVVRNLIRNEPVMKSVVSLLLSPIEELQMASQIIIRQAYDIDIRLECFRALLERHPDSSILALTSSLESFVELARILPEACGFAKTLVRCMTDVIEILTNGRDGLFYNSIFCSNFSRNRLLRLWQAMCQSITTIFRRTPTWSRVIDADAMIEWMRDALIFARDLLAQWRAFETVSSGEVGSPRKSSSIGKQILNDMQPILTESVRWLRLTDLELLHQSAMLIQSLLKCFYSVGLKPSDDAVKKLEKFLESTRRASTTTQASQTKLSNIHLSELASLLAPFTQDDDIQIIEAPSDTQLVEDTRHSRVSASTAPRHSSKQVEFPPKEIAHSSATGPVSKELTSSTLLSQRESRHFAKEQDGTFAKPSKPAKRLIPSKNDARLVKMSESSSDDDASDEGETGGLAALSKLQKSPTVKKIMERRGIKIMEPLVDKNNAVFERLRKRDEARKALMRMKPDLKPLYRLILDWNYDHEGSEPPVSGKRVSYTTIPDNFTSGDDYQSIFQPLLVLECWNQLIKSKQEAIESLTTKINSRQYTDDFLELDISITDRTPDKWRLSEADIVLLRHPVNGSASLCKVQAFRWVGTEVQATLHCRTDANGVDPGLHVNSQWKISRVFSLSTVSREFAALKGLPFYDFFPELMNPRLSRIPDIPPSQIQRTKSALRVNEPQATAILAAMKTDGFTLVQGPPGTGKTSTICGIVGVFISSRPRQATVIQAGHSTLSDKVPLPKILICAPSNAAIDEVAKRLQDGVRTSDGEHLMAKIVRVGAEDTMNISVRDISLDQLVEQRLNTSVKDVTSDSVNTMKSLRVEMDALKVSQASKRQELSNAPENVLQRTILEDELKALNTKRITLSQQYNRSKDQQKAESRRMDAARRKIRAEVLQEADIICSTLSGSGHEALENVDFDTIVIDEAAQAVELSSLIPLKYRAKRCIMVGDPQQLPPTVLSPLASKYRYNQSLFVRLQKSRPEAVHLLSIQYRMHPKISYLPSKLFYSDRLLDGANMAEKTAQPWHTNTSFGAYKFINVTEGGEQSAQGGHSLVNIQECDTAVTLYNRLRREYSEVDFRFRVGVIAMYRAQLVELRQRFKSFFGPNILSDIDFNTVDGFQGQEKDIIILSCVRAGPQVTSIGFLSDHRRLNVAITRARSSLFILGHAATLSRSDDIWKVIVEEAKISGAFVEADASTFQRSIAIKETQSSSESLYTNQISVFSASINSTSDTLMNRKSPPKLLSKLKRKETPSESDQSLPPLISLSKSRPHFSIISGTTDEKLLATSSAMTAVTEEPSGPATQHPPSMIRKKQVKEVNMFIPKKNPTNKRPAPETGSSSQGSAKRRIMDEFRQH